MLTTAWFKKFSLLVILLLAQAGNAQTEQLPGAQPGTRDPQPSTPATAIPAPQTPGPEEVPSVPRFEPTEKISADDAVSFPVDI